MGCKGNAFAVKGNALADKLYRAWEVGLGAAVSRGGWN